MAPSSKKNEPHLTKYIHDELWTTVLSESYTSKFDLYHGNDTSSVPSCYTLLHVKRYLLTELQNKR